MIVLAMLGLLGLAVVAGLGAYWFMRRFKVTERGDSVRNNGGETYESSEGN